jgi:hypothetical protein
MTTVIENLSSNSDINFLSTPNVLTMGSGDNTTKLASTAYAQGEIATGAWLDTSTSQSVVATTITPQIKIDAVDTSSAVPLVLGNAGDSNIQIGVSSVITLLGQVQPFSTLWKYWTTGCSNTTPILGTAVGIQKIQSGIVQMLAASVTINFTPAFASPPIVVLGHTVSGGSITLNSVNKWVSAVGTGTATINSISNPALFLNWIAVGN